MIPESTVLDIMDILEQLDIDPDKWVRVVAADAAEMERCAAEGNSVDSRTAEPRLADETTSERHRARCFPHRLPSKSADIFPFHS